MLGRLFTKLGAIKGSLLITVFSAICSVVLYLIIGTILDKIETRGIITSMIIPLIIAPAISYFFLKMFMQLLLTEKALRKSEHDLEIRNRIANIFLTISDEEFYGEVSDYILEVMESKYGLFGQIAENGHLIIPSLSRDIWNECQVPDKTTAFPPEKWGGLWGRALREGKSFYSNGPFHVPEGHISIFRFLTVPIVYRENAIGLISIANRETDYDEQDKELLESIAGYIAPILMARLQRDRKDFAGKRAEKALRDSEMFLNAVVDNIPDMIFVKDADELRFVRFNKAGENLLGYSKDELVGRNDYDFFPKNEADFFTQKDREVLSSGKLLDISEEPIQTKYRGEKILHTKKIPILDKNGKPEYLLGISEDITERKLAEEALYEEREKLISIFDSIDEVIYVSDPETYELLYVNAKIHQTFGNIEGRKCYEGLQGRDTPCPFCTNDQIFGKNAGQPYIWEFQNKINMRWYRCIDKAIKWPDGRMVRYELAIDIHDRKLAEEAFRDGEKRYRAVVNDMPGMIFRFLPDGTLTFVNSAYCNYFGKTDEELLGRDFFQFIPKTDQENIKSHFLSLTREAPIMTYEHQVMAADGTIRWQEWTDRAIFDEQDRVIEYQCIGKDITEKKLALEEKTKLVKQLEQSQKMEAIGTLAGGIAHDFNNILQAVLGYTELARQKHQAGKRITHELDMVSKAGTRATDLVKQILSFSRQTEPERKPSDISLIVQEALKLLRPSLPTTIEIRQEIADTPDTVLADPTQIHQVLMNLCTNAAHAMMDKGGVLDIILDSVVIGEKSAAQHVELNPGRYQRLTVSDTGLGMDKETLIRIFDPFFTTKEKGKGTGMGMSVVHGIVKSHGGTITVYSELGIGSTFHVYLPILEPGADIQQSAAEPGTLPAGMERILFVDDEEPLVELAREMLESLGYKVTSRTSSIEAMELFKHDPHRFDLIITDLTMPHLTGIELSNEIIKIRPDIPIILCTGFSATITPEKAKAAGIREFVMKPLLIEQIAKTIRVALDG